MMVAETIRYSTEDAAHRLALSGRAVLVTLVACGVLATQACAVEPAAPLAATEAATEVTPTSATLTGTVQSAGTQTSYGVQTGAQAGEYGPDIVVGQQSGTSTDTIALHLSELQPSTTYHYRVYATSQTGTNYGADAVFTTPAYPDLLTQPSTPPLVATPQAKFPSEVPAVTTAPTQSKPHKKGKKKRRKQAHRRPHTRAADGRLLYTV
jgi:hypothetical protein